MKLRALVVVLLYAAGPALGAEIGRLFFTPAQRAALEATRKQALRSEAAPEERKAASPVPQNVTVDGLVRRSDGRTTVWLNNRPLSEKVAGGMKAAPSKTDNRVRLSIPGSDRSVELKVGQTVEIMSGTIEEGYARRAAPPSAAAKASDPDKAEAAAPSPAAGAEPALRESRARARELREMREMLEDAQTGRAGEKK